MSNKEDLEQLQAITQHLELAYRHLDAAAKQSNGLMATAINALKNHVGDIKLPVENKIDLLSSEVKND